MLMVPPKTLVPHEAPPRPAMPGFVRAEGAVRVTFAPAGHRTVPLKVFEAGGYRIRFPEAGGACEGVLINTGGGLVGGDRMALEAHLEAGARAVLTTQAAEKVYRSDGPETGVATSLRLEPDARLDWLPQEQILFDGARLARVLDAEIAADAKLNLVESVVFGRAAMSETVRDGAFRDRWRIRRGGRLVFAEEVRLEGALADILARPATGGGARAVATFLHIAPGAEGRIEAARAALAEAGSEAGASAFDGLLVVRLLARDAQMLRTDLVRFLQMFLGRDLPRSWQT